MSNINNLVPLEYNLVLEGGEITDYWWVLFLVPLIIVIIVIAIMFLGSSNNSNVQSTSVKQSTNMQMGVRTNDNGEKEYYKIVDGEEQPLSEEDIKNLEVAQNSSKDDLATVAKSTTETTASATVNNSV